MIWSGESIKLSDRLQVMAEKVHEGQTAADIGTDHGYLGLYLYEKDVSPRVVLTDISEASLAKAKAAAGAGQFGTDVSFRVGDGLEVLEPGEVDCVVIAGMGGLLIRDILAADIEKTFTFKRFILQPRKAAGHLRKWLLEHGFAILSEDIVREGDFLPEIITAIPMDGSQEIYDFDYFDHEEAKERAGGRIVDLASGARESLLDKETEASDIHFSVPIWMLNAQGPVIEYLERQIGLQEDVLAGLNRARTPDKEAIAQAEYDLDYLRQLREIRELVEAHNSEEAGSDEAS